MALPCFVLDPQNTMFPPWFRLCCFGDGCPRPPGSQAQRGQSELLATSGAHPIPALGGIWHLLNMIPRGSGFHVCLCDKSRRNTAPHPGGSGKEGVGVVFPAARAQEPNGTELARHISPTLAVISVQCPPPHTHTRSTTRKSPTHGELSNGTLSNMPEFPFCMVALVAGLRGQTWHCRLEHRLH